METSTPMPRVWSAPTDDLRDLLSATGPFVTVVLDTSGNIDNAAQRIDVQWRDVRRSLSDQGAPDDVLDSISPFTEAAQLQGRMLVVVANGDGVLHVSHLAIDPRGDTGVLGPLPRLLPLIEGRQALPPYLLVQADRTGADVTVVKGGREEETEVVKGEHSSHIQRVHAGGWSQLRYHHRAESQWEANADSVAETVTKLVDEHDVRLVLVAGDVRAVTFLKEALGQGVIELVREIGGGRGEGSDGSVPEHVQAEVERLVARDTGTLVAKFIEEREQDDKASDGPARTIDALNNGQVATLLVHHDPDDERTAWFGADAVPLATDREQLLRLGIEDPQEDRLVDALVRAAIATAADVHVVPSPEGGPKDGVGALLRFTLR